MTSIVGRVGRLIAVRDHKAFTRIGDIELELNDGDVLFFRPALDDPNVAYKGMRPLYLFSRRTVRSDLRNTWESSWLMVQRQPSRVPLGWDVDHVFPVCWAEAKGFDYVLLTPVPKTPNRSAGAGLEKTAAQRGNEQLLAQYLDIDVRGNYAYLTSAAIAKLLAVAPGPGVKQYPGLDKIKPDLKALQALLAY